MRILVIRPSALGDIIMASPMIRVLRRGFSSAYLAWMAEPAGVGLLHHHPGLDEVIVWPKQRWRMLLRGGRWPLLLRETVRFRRLLRDRKFDLALDAQGLLKSRVLARLSGAGMRVGFDSREPGKSLMTRIISRGAPSKSMGSEYRHLLACMGLAPGPLKPEVFLHAGDERSAEQMLLAEKVARPYAVLTPFTTRAQKHWFEERWAGLAERIQQELQMRVVLLGGAGDRAAAGRILAQSATGLGDLVGRTSLSQSMAVVKHAALRIGVDTGLTHLGAAFDGATVALFGATCPYLFTPSPNFRVIYHRQACSPCRRRPTCRQWYPCMRAITVDEVFATVRQLLQPMADAHAYSPS